MPAEFKLMRKVEFSETDMAGIVHFANFFRYAEAAEHEFFRSLGFSIVTDLDGEHYGWPRVHASCDYVSPLRFEDEFEIHLTVTETKPKSLSYSFVITRIQPAPRVEVAHGSMKTVCVQRDEATQKMRAVEIPRQIVDRIKQ